MSEIRGRCLPKATFYECRVAIVIQELFERRISSRQTSY